MACGLPVAAYGVKGPKDIVEPGLSGVLADSLQELGKRIADVLLDPGRLAMLRKGAVERSRVYAADPILRKLVDDLGLGESPAHRPEPRPQGEGLLAEIMGLVQEG